MRDITDKFTTHLKNVLSRALVFVVENGRQTVKPEHLLWALGTQKGCIAGELLVRVSVSPERLRSLIGATGKESDALSDEATALRLSDPAKRILEKAVLTANVYNHRYIGTEHLLSAMLQVNDPTIDGFFEEEKTDLKELRKQTAVVLKSASSFPEIVDAVPEKAAPELPAVVSPVDEPEKKKTPALDFFGRDLTSSAIQGNIDPVIGREMEIQRVMEILCRRTKNNPLLLGDPGVGKTAIVEGLAKRMLEGNVPHPLRDKRVVALDVSGIVAGTMYRGEFEARLRQIIDEAKAHPDVILFIDEIHTIVGAGAASGSMDAANILKPALARGEIRCIGATTHAEYKKHFETDAALERRFGNVSVDEPSPERTLEILRGIVPNYEAFHGVRMTPAAIEAAVRLSVRHIQDKRLPDKAIDLIDEAAASARVLASEPGPAETLRLLRHRLEELRERKRSAVVEERFEDAKALKDEEETLREELLAAEPSREKPHTLLIDEKDIARVISRMTGTPLNELIEEERSALGKLEEALRARVFGQDKAVASVAAALRRAKTGLAHPNRPLASFLFLGPSGVGKTELAKAVAISAFGDDRSLIRLDMSEFSEPFTASKLVGSPAGYVGYREGAKLTDAVKARPYSVVLFDEIEKAHRDVQNLLLQILEEGELTDATGRKVSFRHAVIIMTSNVGLERFDRSGMGFAASAADVRSTLEADLKAELNERFRPELVNRLDQVCVFEPLNREVLEDIARRALTEVALRLQERGIGFTAEPSVAEWLAEQADPKIGARDIRRKVQTDVEAKIADRLIAGRPPKRLTVSRKGTELVVKETRGSR